MERKTIEKIEETKEHTLVIEGRNAVLEAFRSGRTIDKLFVLDGCQDGPVRTIVREAKKHGTILNFVGKERLSQLMIMQRLTICLNLRKRGEKIRF